MTEEEFRADIRLAALEYLVQRLYAMKYIEAKIPPATVHAAHKGLVESASRTKFREVHPVQSDMASDEFASALARLLEGIESQYEALRT